MVGTFSINTHHWQLWQNINFGLLPQQYWKEHIVKNLCDQIKCKTANFVKNYTTLIT